MVTAEVHATDRVPRPCRIPWHNAIEHLTAVDVALTPEAPAELIADRDIIHVMR